MSAGPKVRSHGAVAHDLRIVILQPRLGAQIREHLLPLVRDPAMSEHHRDAAPIALHQGLWLFNHWTPSDELGSIADPA